MAGMQFDTTNVEATSEVNCMTTDKTEIHHNQVYRLERRRGRWWRLPRLVRRLLQQRAR
jgi:hypothetical protein